MAIFNSYVSLPEGIYKHHDIEWANALVPPTSFQGCGYDVIICFNTLTTEAMCRQTAGCNAGTVGADGHGHRCMLLRKTSSNGVWEPVFCEGLRCEGKSVCLRLPRVQRECGQ